MTVFVIFRPIIYSCQSLGFAFLEAEFRILSLYFMTTWNIFLSTFFISGLGYSFHEMASFAFFKQEILNFSKGINLHEFWPQKRVLLCSAKKNAFFFSEAFVCRGEIKRALYG